MLNIVKLKQNNKKYNIIENKGYFFIQNRHYPPANKEWYNSIYAFNKNTLKLLPVTDKFVIKLIRSYFNMFSSKLQTKTRIGRLSRWLRLRSTNKIFISKPEVKHTSDKVIITLYIYNRQLWYYIRKIKKIKTFAFLKILEIKKHLIKGNCFNKKEKNFFEKKKTYFKQKIQLLKTKALKLTLNIKNKNNLLFKNLKWTIDKLNSTEINFYILFIRKYLKKEIFYLRFMQILHFNKSKLKNTYILPLKSLIEKIYNKKVEFNLVSLKNYHLNSDIFTQILAIKLKKRKNKLIRVLHICLSKIQVPFKKRLEYYIKDTRKITQQNLIISDLINKKILKHDDLLDKILKNLDGLNKNTKLVILKKSNRKIFKNKILIKQKLENFVLNSIKHKTVTGIRIEASGRLTRRLIASRATFKIRYKGTIKNINSSYRGLSSVLLRGNLKSNTQLSKISNQTPIGAFGLKGWISSY